MHPEKNANAIVPKTQSGPKEKIIQVDKAERNSIMRRFISYYIPPELR
jgi:hypothetical protein